MYKMLLGSALRKGYKNNIAALSKILGIEDTFNIDKIDEEINKLVKKYTDSHTYLLAGLLKLCFKNEFDEIVRNSQDTLCLLIYRNKEKIKNNFKILKNKWRKAKDEVINNKRKILSRELRELEFILKLDEEEFKKLLEVFSLLGEIVDKIYSDLKEIAEKKEKDWKELNIEEIKEITELYQDQKKKGNFIPKCLVIAGLVLLIGGCFLLKKNFGFVNLSRQTEVRFIKNGTKTNSNNKELIQHKNKQNKEIIHKS